DAADTLHLMIGAMTGMVGDMKADKAAMEKSLAAGFITATDLADWLVRAANIPFRDAHHITGKIVRVAERNNCDLADLKLADMQKIDARITKDVFSVLTPENAVNSRKSIGGTA